MAGACSHQPATSARDGGIDAAVPRDGLSCAPSGSCTTGPLCNGTCCAVNEACIGGTCMCGDQPSCTDGNACAAPIVIGNHCGDICCGATAACPGVLP